MGYFRTDFESEFCAQPPWLTSLSLSLVYVSPMAKKHLIYVDGQEGTTGLRINDLLASREELEILKIAPKSRKDSVERSRLINEADLVFLCLPDAASREAVAMVSNPRTRVIDASTAFRTSPDWVYGLPELEPTQREKIRNALRVANPGCHATAFILLVRPLIDMNLIPREQPLTATSITGFSGGGRNMIEDYEAAFKEAILVGAPILHGRHFAPRPYALGLSHKHLPEMTRHAGLANPPLFMPIVGPNFQGLTISIPLTNLGLTFAREAHDCLMQRYQSELFVRVMPMGDPETLQTGFLDCQRCNDTNRADVFVFSNGDQVILMASIDNLGKGASGAAVQNMNLMLGLDECAGLVA